MEGTDHRIEIIISEESTGKEISSLRMPKASKEDVELAQLLSDFLFSRHFPLPSARADAKNSLISAINAFDT